jgi:hypothetical protein
LLRNRRAGLSAHNPSKIFQRPMAADFPVALAKLHAASTLGPIDPAGKVNAAIASGGARRKTLAVGFPKSL